LSMPGNSNTLVNVNIVDQQAKELRGQALQLTEWLVKFVTCKA
jgi:hypothetical protein